MPAPLARDADREIGLDILARMLRTRRFEERIVELVSTGELGGPARMYIAQEAIAAGVCAARDDDSLRDLVGRQEELLWLRTF